MADVLPSFAEGAGPGTVRLSKPKGSQDFYTLAQPDGDVVVFGVVDDVLVVANDPQQASRLAGEEPVAVPGAKGSVAMSADAEQLVNTLLDQFGPALGLGDLGGLGAALFTGPLGDLNGSMSASTDELRGSDAGDRLAVTIRGCTGERDRAAARGSWRGPWATVEASAMHCGTWTFTPRSRTV